jgi:hypothetical protein
MASTQTTTVLNCVLGNILGCNNSNPIDYSNHVWKLYRGTQLLTYSPHLTHSLIYFFVGIFKDATSDSFQANYLFRQNSVILSWNDSRGGSDSELKAEEAIYKQYQYDTKKYQKKNSNSKGPKKVLLLTYSFTYSLTNSFTYQHRISTRHRMYQY